MSVGRWWSWALSGRRPRARPTPQALAAVVLALEAHDDAAACRLLREATDADCASRIDGTVAPRITACELAPAWPSRPGAPMAAGAVGRLPPLAPGVTGEHDTEPFRGAGLVHSRWLPIGPAGWVALHRDHAARFEAAADAFIEALASLLSQRSRLQAQAAPALLDAWPALWFVYDSRVGRLVHWHPALPARLALGAGTIATQPAAQLFAAVEGVDPAELLARPLGAGAPVELRLRWRHAHGEPLEGLALGRAAPGMLPPGWVLWSLLAEDAPQQPALPLDWALEAERQRRETGARALHGLAAPLVALRHRLAQEPAPPRDSLLQALQEAGAAAEQLAAQLAAPAQRASDLMASLQSLAAGQQARCGVRCDFACDDPALACMRLADPAKLVGYRACKVLLEHFTAEWHGESLELRLDTVASRRMRHLRCRLSAPGAPTQTVLDRRELPGAGAGLGLFAVQASVAGVGGRLVVAPGDPPGLLAEFELPLAV